MPCSAPHCHAYANLPQVDFSGQYWMDIFELALRDLEDGLMPNPNVWCNREIKFGLLMDKTILTQQQWLTTGHYAGIAWSDDNRPWLIHTRDCAKDQVKFLRTQYTTRY